MPPLVDALERGSISYGAGSRLNAFNGGGAQRSTGCAPMRANLDTLPMPARHLISHYAPEYYINFRKPLALMETARGCPFKCNFCSVWKFHDSTFREKSPDRVVAELAAIEAPNVFITDDIFWLDVRRGEELAKKIKEAGIKKYFTVQTRTDIICKFPHLIEMWKDCGQLSIFLGLESITDEGLDAVNKSNTAANNVRALSILKELGVGFTPNFIVDPAWDHDDFARLRAWIEETGAYNSGFSVLTPLPGTDLWETARNQVTTHDWEMFDIIHAVLPTKLPLADFYEEYSRLCGMCWRCATACAARRAPTSPWGRRSPPARCRSARSRRDEHRQGVQQAGDVPQGARTAGGAADAANTAVLTPGPQPRTGRHQARISGRPAREPVWTLKCSPRATGRVSEPRATQTLGLRSA